MWYGLSSIAARFINYLLTPLLTYNLAEKSDYGKIGLIYSAIPILNIIFTYGFETAYFRFAAKDENKKDIYSTAALSLFFSTILFTAILWINQQAYGNIVGLSDFPSIIQISIFIIAFDALSIIPFARLRQEGRPRKFAFIKIAGIFINIFFTWFFIVYCPQHVTPKSNSIFLLVYNKNTNPVVYVMLANLLQAVFTLVLLGSEIKAIRFNFNTRLWKQMMLYSMPLIIAGMGGMINETFDRLMLRWWLPGNVQYREEQIGIYNACYKLSILISLFIQAFRLGAEPFFFKQAQEGNAPKTYARVMKFFVITVCCVFLLITLFIPVWRWFIKDVYWDGLAIVPVLVLANMCLGVYYNLSIWYKVTNNTMAGATITIIGAAITCVINYFFIPRYSFVASAWATFACYASMMLISYLWGQKKYYVPYAWKKLLAYTVIVIALFFMHKGILAYSNSILLSLVTGVVFTLLFLAFVIRIERKEFQQFPVIGKFIK
ncbi:oligosaccharide flippase family protein [Limnovirga soli]|uniref:Oligosaccharide flippase family protein n=1 Tax=Limnovirga soli TaxID=2656915 RepID=A0A8J8FEE4_9BACT|nr:oligosaccharide flippase family protein [Limnovirga soli]NNV56535.1 oligosaccharide flippase family protein [Limnovirga soli]